MAFLIGILVGVIFVWLALRSGLYSTFALMFNLVIAVYLAIFLRPVVTGFLSSTQTPTAYLNALVLFLTAAASFAILHGITFVFFTGPYNVVFPKVFDIIAAGFVGFLSGLFVWSFISLLITITPIAQNSFLKDIGFSYSKQESSNLTYWCGFIHKLAGSRSGATVDKTITNLLEDSMKKLKPQEPQKAVASPQEPATKPAAAPQATGVDNTVKDTNDKESVATAPSSQPNMTDANEIDMPENLDDQIPVVTEPKEESNEVNVIQKDPNVAPVATVSQTQTK